MHITRTRTVLLTMVAMVFAATALTAGAATVTKFTAKNAEKKTTVQQPAPKASAVKKSVKPKKHAKKPAKKPAATKRAPTKPSAAAKKPSITAPRTTATPSAPPRPAAPVTTPRGAAPSPGDVPAGSVSSTPAARAPVVVSSPRAEVAINGVALSESQVSAFTSTYGTAPKSGAYWYDAVSGLYGAVGQASSGFMLPGHNFGSLAANASNGTSGVFFNGRQLTITEVSVIEALIGVPAIPGRYWFDASGNVGIEGSPFALLNLATTGGGGGGGGGGGDNFWSSRFSAGNSTADNSQGYVSVPGYGPVSYGF